MSVFQVHWIIFTFCRLLPSLQGNKKEASGGEMVGEEVNSFPLSYCLSTSVPFPTFHQHLFHHFYSHTFLLPICLPSPTYASPSTLYFHLQHPFILSFLQPYTHTFTPLTSSLSQPSPTPLPSILPSTTSCPSTLTPGVPNCPAWDLAGLSRAIIQRNIRQE